MSSPPMSVLKLAIQQEVLGAPQFGPHVSRSFSYEIRTNSASYSPQQLFWGTKAVR